MSYFAHRVTNAGAEASTPASRQSASQRAAYRNRKNFKTAIWFHLGGLQLYLLPLDLGYPLKSRKSLSVRPTGVKARCPLRLHQCARVSPTPGDGCRHRRGRGCAPAGRQRPYRSGVAGFLTQVFNRVRRAGATGPMVLRADSGFYSSKVTKACSKAGVSYSVTVRTSKALHKVIAAIKKRTGHRSRTGSTTARMCRDDLPPFSEKHPEVRLIVRRVKPTPGSQLALFSTYDYHAFITDREGETIYLEADHRRHAVVEDVIRRFESTASG